MSNTTNLNLEHIENNDSIKTDFIRKINDNNTKIDNAYGVLTENLMNKTQTTTLAEAIADVKKSSEYIDEIDELKKIGNATAGDILSGKKALVKGETVTGTALSVTTTATSNDILNGKTAYNNSGTLITGTASSGGAETVEQTITASTSNEIETFTFTFSKDITNARIIYQAFSIPTAVSSYYSPTRYVLMNLDTSYDNATCLATQSRSYYSSAYSIPITEFGVSKNGNTLTITPTNSAYGLRAYIGDISAIVTAIWE